MNIRAFIERDLGGEVKTPRWFVLRSAVAAAPGLGLFWVAVGSQGAPADEIGRSVFSVAGGLLLTVLLLILPAFFAQALARERLANALDVLLTAPLGRGGILLGLWLPRIVLVLLLLACGFPFVALAVTFGGVTPVQFLCWCALVGLQVLWVGALALAVGARVRDPGHATRTAYVGTAFGVVIAPLLASGLEQLVPGNAATAGAAQALAAWSPYAVFAQIKAESGGGSGSFHMLVLSAAWAAGVTVLSLIVAARAVSRKAHRRARPAPGTRRGFLARIIDRWPMVWLGLSRRLRLRISVPVLVGVGAILAAELPFWQERGALRSLLGLGGGSSGLFHLHMVYVTGYLAVALIAAMLAAATALARELQANTLDVLYATPLSNNAIIRGLFVAALVAGLPFWLLSMLHLAVGEFDGAFPGPAALLFPVTSATLIVLGAARAFLHGVQERRPLKAVTQAFAATTLFWIWRMMLCLAIAPIMILFAFVFPAILLVSFSLHPIVFAIAPLVPLDAAAAAAVGVLLMAVLLWHLWELKRLITSEIPRRFIVRRDPRVGSRQLVKRLKLEQRGLALDGQARPQ